MMKKIFSRLVVGGLLLSNLAFGQKHLDVTGSYRVSCFLTKDNKVFVSGQNWNGMLGLGIASTEEPTPKEVTFFTTNNINIKQVTCNYDFFLALDCNNNVWGWGFNFHGALGDTMVYDFVTKPARIKIPAGTPLAGTRWDVGGYLGNVRAVHTSIESSFAILDDGRMVAWGSNGEGKSAASGIGVLGDGTKINKNYPVFVKTGAGDNDFLRNIKQVSAGDFACFALCDDDGDGLGTVYSWGWGTSGVLGRNADGTANPKNYYDVQSSYAMPVLNGDNSPLKNIVQISGVGVSALALDPKGHVWSWGDALGISGQGQQIYDASVPKRVVKGTTTGASNDGTYLLATSVASGAAVAYALTPDNKVVSWGGGEGEISGLAGNGTTTGNSYTPAYVKVNANEHHGDVASIYSSALGGYYQRKDGSLWGWGGNEYGQLGVGNKFIQLYAVELPSLKGQLRPLQPVVNMKQTDTTYCYTDKTDILLKSGFIVPVDANGMAMVSSYAISWYKGSVMVQGNYNNGVITGSASNFLNLLTSDTGTYTLKLFAVTPNCYTYDTIVRKVRISAFNSSFDVPTGLSYCTGKASVHVNSALNTKPRYDWFASEQSTEPLASSTGSTPTLIDPELLQPATGAKIAYVEETAAATGMVFKKNEAADPTWKENSQYLGPQSPVIYQTGLTVSEPVRIDSVSIALLVTAYSQFLVDSMYGTIFFGIYDSQKLIENDRTTFYANKNKRIGMFPAPFKCVVKKKTTYAQITDSLIIVRVPVNILLPGDGTYFISMLDSSQNAIINGVGAIKLAGGGDNIAQTVPVSDDIYGRDIVRFTAISLGFNEQLIIANQGYFFDISFSTPQQYCTRKSVELIDACPTTPTQLSAAYRGKTLEHLSLEVSADAVANAQVYEWTLTPQGGKPIVFKGDTTKNTAIIGKYAVPFATTFDVAVRARVGNKWSVAGQIHKLSTPAAPLTRLGAQFHNMKMRTMQDTIVAIKVTGATLYLYQFIDEKTGARFRHYNKGNSLRVGDVPGLQLGHSYQVTVLPRFYNSLSQFSVGARIFTPATK